MKVKEQAMAGRCFGGCLAQLSYYCHLFGSLCWTDMHWRWVRALSAPRASHHPEQPVTISLQSLLHLSPLPRGFSCHPVTVLLSTYIRHTKFPRSPCTETPRHLQTTSASGSWRHLLKQQYNCARLVSCALHRPVSPPEHGTLPASVCSSELFSSEEQGSLKEFKNRSSFPECHWTCFSVVRGSWPPKMMLEVFLGTIVHVLAKHRTQVAEITPHWGEHWQKPNYRRSR